MSTSQHIAMISLCTILRSAQSTVSLSGNSASRNAQVMGMGTIYMRTLVDGKEK